MLGKERSRSYQEFNDDEYDIEDGNANSQDIFEDSPEDMEPENPNGSISQEEEDRSFSAQKKFSKNCVKNVCTVVLISIYVMLTTVAAFLVYQTISDFIEKLNHPVMSVIYKEVELFSHPGIALYLGNAKLLSCKHYYHDYIPPLVNPGTPQEGDCIIDQVTYIGPFTNESQKKALVVRGPSDVRKKELIFMQFSQNETQEDFSAITYMLFAKFSDFAESGNQSQFMTDCERNYSMWTFSGGFRTWVKMSLVKTSGTTNDGIEFRQESTVVKFNDKRAEAQKTNELFFVVFEWRDPFIQEIRLIVAANAWSSIAILCGVSVALFKAANFAKLSIQWIIRMRKRHLRNKAKELNQIN